MRASSLTTSVLLAGTLALLTVPLAAQEALEGQALHEIEVIDENEFRLEVEKTELEFHPGPGELDEGDTNVEDLLFKYTPVERFNPYLYDSEKVECALVPDFGSRPVSRAPVVVFRTDFAGGADVVEWQLGITDYRGELFRTISGEGRPPESLEWDGRGNHEEILKPGFPYSFLFTIEDSGTNRYQYAGNTFSLPFLSYKDGRNLRVEAAGHSLFEESVARPLDKADTEVDRILREILDSPQQALQVEAWAISKELAAARAAWLARTLEKRLLLSEGQVAHEGHLYKGDPPGRDGMLRVTLLKGKRG